MNIIFTDLPENPHAGGSAAYPYFGRSVARAGFVQAVLRCSRQTRIIVYTPPSLREEYTARSHDYLSGERLELLNAPAIRSTLHDRGPTVIHTMDSSLLAGLHLRWMCGSQPWPVLGMTHDLSSMEAYNDLLLTLIGRPTASDAIVCTTRGAQSTLMRLLRSAATSLDITPQLCLPIIPLGVDMAAFPSQPRDVSISRGTLPPHRTRFLYLGRLDHRMKADLLPLLTAFSEVRSSHPACLVIAGSASGSCDEDSLVRLRRRISQLGLDEDVSVRVNITERQRLDLLCAADVFVSPADSLQESFGLVLLEAMASRLPVIASDWNGYRDIVEDQTTGLLIGTAMPLSGLSEVSRRAPLEDRYGWYEEIGQAVVVDIALLTGAMIALIEDAPRRRQMGEAGHARVREHFDWSHVIAQYEQQWTLLTTLSTSNPEPPAPSIYWYDHTQVFYTHPTRHFTPDAYVRRRALADVASVMVTAPPRFLSSAIIQSILDRLVQPMRIAELPLEMSTANRYVAYLLKHGLVELTTAPG